MKPKRPLAGNPLLPVKRPPASAAAVAAAVKSRRRNQLVGQLKTLATGVLVICGIWIVFDMMKPPAQKSAPVTLEKSAGRITTPVVPAVGDAPEDNLTAPVASAETKVADSSADGVLKTATKVAGEVERFEKEAELVLTGLDTRKEAVIARDKALFARAIQGQAWNAYRQLLAKSIDAGLAKLGNGAGANRYDAVWKEPFLYQAILRWQVVGRLSEPVIVAQVPNTYKAELFTWLCYNTSAMEEFMLTLKPEDDGGKVLKFLMEAWSNTPGKMEKYFPLALACAVVFDSEVKIPNPVGDSASDKPVVVALSRYAWFMEKNEKGLLTADVHHSSARDLVWVVCAPITTSELEWSLDKMNLSRQNWGSAYGSIEYLMERAVKGLDPYKEYSFSEILKEGGICGDQSYYTVNTARAQGIPAMTLSGETDMGGHAWVGLKIKPDEWTTGIGRVGGVAKGEADNPQTGKTITEQEIQMWSDRIQSPTTQLAVARHLWLAGFFETTEKEVSHAETVQLANQIGPAFTETWAALFALLQKQMTLTGEPAKPSNLEDWKGFAAGMRREFKDNPRMAQLAARAETEFIFPYGEDADATRTLSRERRRIERNSGEQKDLIAESLKREAELIFKRGEPTAKQDISRLYDSALRKYGGSITGFKMMAEDYFGYFKDDAALSPKVARDIELAFKRVVETGSKDFFRAKTETEICKMICSYYRSAGDEKRAQMLEKRYETLLKRAERGAL
jgi:hypothetical protein